MSKERKLVSVCIPVYNGAKFIRETISSVLKQKYDNMEILIQDNNSEDDTWQIIKEIASKDNRIIISRNESTLGMSKNWNKVVSKANGEYVILLSADDLLLPDFVNRTLKMFDLNPDIGVVTTNHYILRNNCIYNRKINIKEGIYCNFLNMLVLLNPFSINFTLFKRSVIKNLSNNANFFTSDFITCDYDLWFRICEYKIKVYYIAEPLGLYRVHDFNLSKKKIIMNRSTFFVLKKYRENFSGFNQIFFKVTLLRIIFRIFLYWIKGDKFDKKFFLFLIRYIIKR